MDEENVRRKMIQIRKTGSPDKVETTEKSDAILVKSVALRGTKFEQVTFEISLLPGIPRIEFIGLFGAAANEAKLKLNAVLKNSSYKFPGKRITVALCDGDRIYYQPQFDLAVLCGILSASKQIKMEIQMVICAALSITGSFTEFPYATGLLAKIREHTLVLIPEHLTEMAVALEINTLKIQNIEQLRHLSSLTCISPKGKTMKGIDSYSGKLLKLKGQSLALRAIQIAAAGRHPIAILGSSGSGKSEMLGLLLHLLPDLDLQTWKEQLQLQAIEEPSIQAIEHGPRSNLQYVRPGMSRNQIIGREDKTIGVWSLSKYGVLFLEEFTQMSPSQLNLIQELLDLDADDLNEEGLENSKRIIIAAANPCPCGRYYEKDGSCKCSMGSVKQRLGKLHTALKERFDLWLCMRSPDSDDQRRTITEKEDLNLLLMKSKVDRALERRQAREYKRQTKPLNERYVLDESALNYAEQLGVRHKMSLRSYKKLFSVARTIADLDAYEKVEKPHFVEAAQYVLADFHNLIK